MKSLIDLYSAYNEWANKKLTDAILLMKQDKTKEHVISSFPSIHATLIHMHNAEGIWFNRVNKTSNTEIPLDDEMLATGKVISYLLEHSGRWKKYTIEKSENDLIEKIRYKNIRGEEFYQPLHDILTHVFNHSTYHRGQLVTMMRTLGETVIPKTDLIDYSRSTFNVQS